MKRQGTSADWSLSWWMVTLITWMSVWPLMARAQQGDNAVWGASALAPSTAFIDATQFSGPRGEIDVCAMISGAFHYISTHSSQFPLGAVVDARGVIPPTSGPPLMCPINGTHPTTPWVYTSSDGTQFVYTGPSTVLLPAETIVIQTTWILPDHTRLVGDQTTEPGQTTIKPSNFSAIDNTIIEMGSSSLCSNGCTGISIEDMTIDSQSLLYDTIYNAYAGDQSYVYDVNIRNVALNALVIAAATSGTSYAADSGPYSHMNIVSAKYAGCTGPGNCPACVQLHVQTRGVRDLTCIGNQNTGLADGSGPVGVASIYVDASNNSISDVHIESFWDGVEVGSGSGSNVGNIVLTNVDGATKGFNGTCGQGNTTNAVINLIHLCGLNVPYNRHACQSSYTGLISGVTIVGAKLEKGGSSSAVIQDDLAEDAITLPDPSKRFTIGLYALGEPITGTSSGYSRLTSVTTTAVGSTSAPISVPTWGIGGGPPAGSCNPGTIYSNTQGTGGSSYTLYVCTSAGSWQHLG